VGIFYKRGNGDGAFWTLVLGSLIGVIIFILDLNDIWPYHYTINVGIVIILSSIIFVLISNMTKAPDPEAVASYVYDRSLLTYENENMPWYKDFRYQSAFLVLMVVLTAIMLW